MELPRRPTGCALLALSFFAAAAGGVPVQGESTTVGGPCPGGWWGDLMLGSHHVRPYRHFDDFNPGIGFECTLTPQWATSTGYFRNSLDRPSFYAGAVYTSQVMHWRWLRLGAMGGVISGYNFGRFALGAQHRTGLVLAPTVLTEFRRMGINFILIPPIREKYLPFTVGFQLKFRVN